MIKTEGWFTDLPRLVVQQLTCSYNLAGTILYSYVTTQCQPGKPLAMLLNECRPSLLPMLFSVFTPVSCQTEVDIQTGHHSPSQPFSERCRWPVATSSPSPPLSQSSSHVDLLQRSQSNTELLLSLGLCAYCLHLAWSSSQQALTGCFSSFSCQPKCHFLYLK